MNTPGSPKPQTGEELKRVIEAEREGRPFLLYRDADGAHQVWSFEPDLETVTIGRSEGNKVPLPWDTDVSRAHAEIRELAGEWVAMDDGLSRNGTFVNGERVSGRKRLESGDTLRVGRTLVLFYAPGEGASTAITTGEAEGPTVEDLTPTQRKILIALCRPFQQPGGYTGPATNREIGEEVFLSVDAVKGHLRALFAKLEIEGLPQNKKRARLAELALTLGLVSDRDFKKGPR